MELFMLTTSCCQYRQRIRDLLIHLLVGKAAPVKLVEDLAVLDKQNPVRTACRLHAVRNHENCLPVLMYLGKQPHKLIRSL